MNKPGFASTESRMKSKTADKSPGPGHYLFDNKAAELRKKAWGWQGVFGSSEKRFPVHASLVFVSFDSRKCLDLGFMICQGR